MKKPKDQTLDGSLKTAKLYEWVELPLENLTKQEFQLIIGADLQQRLLDMMQSGTSTRDIVVEGVGLVDLLLARLLSLDGYTKKANLHDRIEEAHKRGLISDKAKLHIHRKIRNAFAHDPELHHLEHDDKVHALCQHVLPGGAVPEGFRLREQYVFAVMAPLLELEKAVKKRGG